MRIADWMERAALLCAVTILLIHSPASVHAGIITVSGTIKYTGRSGGESEAGTPAVA